MVLARHHYPCRASGGMEDLEIFFLQSKNKRLRNVLIVLNQ
jgi:hypothetical protein